MREFVLRLRGADLELVEAAASASQTTPTEILTLLLQNALAGARLARKVGREMLDKGLPPEQVDAFNEKLLGMDALRDLLAIKGGKLARK